MNKAACLSLSLSRRRGGVEYHADARIIAQPGAYRVGQTIHRRQAPRQTEMSATLSVLRMCIHQVETT